MKTVITTLNSKFIHSSLSIRYLKSYCKAHIPNIIVQEYTINQNSDLITGEIFKAEPDIVAFSCYIWNIRETLEIAERLKIVNPDVKVIFGGPEVSFDGEELMEKYSFIDYIVYGEGEETLRELLIEFRKSTRDFRGILGLIYRDISTKKIIKNPPRGLICNLDDIPTPFDENLDIYNNKIVYYESSRGCPFNCRFCLSSTISGVRFFSLKRVMEDLRKLISAGVKQVKFVDRTFNARKEYALEIMKFLIEETKGVKQFINFHFEVTAHLLDEEVLNFLKEVPEGLFQFEIGVQSTNPETIDEINRNTDITKLMEVVKRIKSYKNIHQHLDLIAGLPYENYNTFKKSFNDVYNMEPDKLQLGFLKLLKGSELRVNKDKYNYRFLDKSPYEVLENDYIHFEELLRLKVIEELLEAYGNKVAFRNTIKFIVKNFYKSPFDFYEDFSIYWESKEYHTRHHSEKSLYKMIFEFYASIIDSHMDAFKEILKFDFLYNSNNPNLPEYLCTTSQKEVQIKRHSFLQNESYLSRYLSKYTGFPVKKIIKETHFARFSIDILKLVEMDYRVENIIKHDTVILFIYNPENPLNKCNVHDVSKEFRQMEEGVS